MSKKKRIILVSIFYIGFVVFGFMLNGPNIIAASEDPKDRPIKIGWMAWTENEAMMATSKLVLEEIMGYKVEPVFLELGVAIEALASGKIDVFFELSVPSYHLNYWKQVATKIWIAGNCYPFCQASLYVPNYIPIEEVRSINDLKKPEIKKKFGAKIIAIDPGSGTNQITERTIKAYNLDYKLISGSEAGNLATLMKAVDKKAWSIHSLWTPHYIWGVVDARALEDPLHAMGAPDLTVTAVRQDLMMHTTKEVGKFLSRFHFPMKEIQKVMAWISKDGMSSAQAARKYVKENPKRVHYWITGEIKE